MIENWMTINYSEAVPINNAFGNSYRSAKLGGWSWAKQFTSTEDLVVTIDVTSKNSDNSMWVGTYGTKKTDAIPYYYLVRPTAATTAIPLVSVYACGT